jgi:competence ComEA-like helix-hairpin-helix protein
MGLERSGLKHWFSARNGHLFNSPAMKSIVVSSFHFSRTERIGAIFLAVICTAIFALPDIAGKFKSQTATDFSKFQTEIQAFRRASPSATPAAGMFAFDPNTASFDDFVRLGLSEKVANIICNYRDKGGTFREPEDFQKIWGLSKENYERLLPFIRIESFENEGFETKQAAQKIELFTFDPNTATEQDFLRLGLPKWTVKSILNYRAKGGQFRKKEDFRKIYTLDEEDYLRLESYITIGGGEVAATEAPRPQMYSGGSGNPAPNFAAKISLDINRASVEDWQKIPGIGEKRARQMVNFRESLGGFLSIEQVSEMYGLPDSIFQKIRPMLTLSGGGVRQLNLNAATFDDLEGHPYISGKQAKLIVAYREQHGAFASVDDLAKIATLTDKKWLEKVRPYLTVK